jgi:phosphohistidine phosphatase
MNSTDKLVIWVLRHAKAASDGPSGDVSRPLTGRGRRQAESVREHLQSLGQSPKHSLGQALPTLVLCSPATRARETAETVMPALPEAHIQFEQVLYDEDADGVLEWLKQLDPPEPRIMIVGHNPTLHELCLILTETDSHEEVEALRLPTAALVRLDEAVAGSSRGSGSWSSLTVGGATLGHRFVPQS